MLGGVNTVDDSIVELCAPSTACLSGIGVCGEEKGDCTLAGSSHVAVT